MSQDQMSQEWYWDLNQHRAVTAAERGPDDRVLGPYPTKAQAQNWQEQSQQRNESWDDADDDWNQWPNDDD